MHILLCGIYSNHWSTTIEMESSLCEMGHQVSRFDNRLEGLGIIDKILLKIVFQLRRLRLQCLSEPIFFLTPVVQKTSRNLLLKEQELKVKPDLILLCKSEYVDPRSLHKLSTPICFYFMDPPQQARRLNSLAISKNALISFYTFSSIVQAISRRTPKRVLLTRQGYDKSKFYPINEWHSRLDRVVFVGTYSNSRSKVIKMISQLIKVDCYGLGWENPPVYTKDLNLVYNKYRYALNLTRSNDGFSVRVPQILGSGACLVSDLSPDIKDEFPPETYLSIDEMLTSHCFSDQDFPKNHHARALAGHMYALQHFTWNTRLSLLLDTINTYNS